MTTNSSNDDRIRVALVITELNVGGAERCLTQLAIGLNRRRFEPLVIAIAPRPLDEQLTLVNLLEAAQVPVRFLNVSSKWQLPIGVWRLRRILAAFEPDVVQSFLFHADVLTCLAGGGRRCRSFLGLRVADPTRWRQRCERWVAGQATAVVCVSEAVSQYARDEAKIQATKLVVIPNAIDVEIQCSVKPLDLMSIGIGGSRRVILCVGRLHKQKGMDWLLETMPAVFERLPEHDLLIVGTGPDETRLRAQARDLKIDDRVHFAGWRDDVPRLMAASSQLVLTSRWEGMPNVILEAMAAALPIVATNTHGVRELLGADHARQTVEFGDSLALIDRLASFGRDDELAARIGAANLSRAVANFSLEGMVTAYESLYESNNHGSRGQ
ncbi:MAG: glycosyltransferase [Pirellulaceae bacterium]|jgi:glycosyltransferase involved in cell wall biosynthesis|nr:glycosyltransferase [Pirellulaceae bacterium]MDP6557112.1 glycosyltransferase [Pirellulaceae bacterium]